MLLLRTFLIILLLSTSTGCLQKSSQEVGGIRFGSGSAYHQPAEPDPTILTFPRARGQVKFNLNLERNFKPSPKPNRPLPRKRSNGDPVPNAIEKAVGDTWRNSRIKRVVR